MQHVRALQLLRPALGSAAGWAAGPTAACTLPQQLGALLAVAPPQMPHPAPAPARWSAAAARSFASSSEPNRGNNSVQGTQEGVAGSRFSPRQPDNHRAAGASGGGSEGIRAELAAAGREGGPQAVLRVVERHGQDFDEAALVEALRALGESLEGRAGGGSDQGQAESRELAQHQAFQSLLSMVVAGVERLTTSQVATVARHLGRLPIAPGGGGAGDAGGPAAAAAAAAAADDHAQQAVFDAIGRNIISELERMSGPELADLAEGYAASGATPGRVLADALHDRLTGGSGGASSGGALGGVSPERVTADGAPLGAVGGEAGAGRGAQVDRASRERVREALRAMGYPEGSAGGQVRAGQSDRSHGLDYS